MQYLPVTPAHAYACSCPSDLVPSAMDPAPASGSDDFGLWSRISGLESLDGLRDTLASLQSERLRVIRHNLESEDPPEAMNATLRALQQQIDNASCRFARAKQYASDELAQARNEEGRLMRLVREKKRRLDAARRKERLRQAITDGPSSTPTGEEWWQGLMLLAFGAPVVDIPGAPPRCDDAQLLSVTPDMRKAAALRLVPVNDAQDKVLRCTVTEQINNDYDGEEIFGVWGADGSLSYAIHDDYLVKLTVKNLSYATIKVRAVYYMIHQDDTQNDREEQKEVEIKQGEDRDMEYPLKFEIANGELEIGWKLFITSVSEEQTLENRLLVVRFLPEVPGGQRLGGPDALPGSHYDKVLQVAKGEASDPMVAEWLFRSTCQSKGDAAATHSAQPAQPTANGPTRSAQPAQPGAVSDAFLQSIEEGHWALIPSFEADGRTHKGDHPKIPLAVAATELALPFHETVSPYYTNTVPYSVVLQGKVVEGVQYQLATNVSNPANPLLGTKLHSFILTSTEMAMACLEDMPKFIKLMPGPLNFNRGVGATTFAGEQWQVMGYYAPISRRLSYTSLNQTQAIQFRGSAELKAAEVDSSDSQMIDVNGAVHRYHGRDASRTYERWQNAHDAITKGEIVAVAIKTPAMKPIPSFGGSGCPICMETRPDMLVLRPCGHKACVTCFAKWSRSQGLHPSCPLCRAAVVDTFPLKLS